MSNNIIAIQMDTLSKLSFETDSTWLISCKLFERKFNLFIYTPKNLFYKNGKVYAYGNFVDIISYAPAKYKKAKAQTINLEKTKAILIRQNPPFNMEYITTTYLLELIKDKTLIINNPTEIRNYPEKLSVLNFPELIPPTIIASSNLLEITQFIEAHQEVVLKPIYAFGGFDIKKLTPQDNNTKEIIKKYLRKYGSFILQKYLPMVKQGDKRIILVDGEILGVMRRVPNSEDFRANLAAGGTAQPTELTKQEAEICNRLKPELKKRGLFIVGIDIIGEHLIEINVTSPTGLVAINILYNRKVETEIVNQIETKLLSML